MLDDDVRAEIEAMIAGYAEPMAASVEALQAVQRREGWVSDQHLRDVAEILGVGAAELDGVASFYNLLFRRPVGRRVVLVCDSVSCWVMGYDRVLAAVQEQLGIGLGETTADGAFTLLPMCCLGACDHAPVLMVGEDTHPNVDPNGVAALLDPDRSA